MQMRENNHSKFNRIDATTIKCNFPYSTTKQPIKKASKTPQYFPSAKATDYPPTLLGKIAIETGANSPCTITNFANVLNENKRENE